MEVVAGVPKLSVVLLAKLDNLKQLLHHSREEVREWTAQLVAVVACHCHDDTKMDAFLNDLGRNLRDKPLEQQHGSLLAIGYSVGRIVRHFLADPANDEVYFGNSFFEKFWRKIF